MPLATGWSAERLLVSDPEQHTAEWVQKEFGPHGFAVSGNLIVLPNEVRGDITIYRDGRPILHKSTLAEGPGPFPDGATYDLQAKTASIQPADGTPAVLFHGHDILGLDLLATDDAFVWYRVEDMVGGDYVNRVPRSGSARIREYRRADRHGAGTRDLVVDGGLVYALSMTSHMAAAQVLLLGPVP